jgi:hypothetical protein
MELKMERNDWLFFLLCLIVAIVAEESFFMHPIGISYFIFIAVFYMLFYWRFRSFPFTHQRLGYLLLIAIWILAAGYYLYDTSFFYGFNLLVIPCLVIFHLTLITSPQKMEWSNLAFINFIVRRIFSGIHYSASYISLMAKNSVKDKNNNPLLVIGKKIVIGLVISIPFLFIILNLLIEADAQFERLMVMLPELVSFRIDYVIRFIIILIYALGFFGFMQVLLQNKIEVIHKEASSKPFSLDGIISLTFIVLLDIVYVVFVAVQFKYFFSGTLESGLTYAEYARKGFFELLFVTIINLSITTVIITFSKNNQGFVKQLIRIALSLLVLSSGILLVSAMMRMMMYENAYGFTFTRVLAHSFMIFLMIIFAYTLVKIWLEKLSLFHFYFIASLVYYVGINVVNIDSIVVEQNITRYEETGKIDIDYLNHLSSTGKLGLIQLYENNPEISGLEDLLKNHKSEQAIMMDHSWQSHNHVKSKFYAKLGEINF